MNQEVIEITEREIEVIEVIEKGLIGPTGPTGPQANINYTVVTTNQTLTNSQNIAADTSGGSFTLTLPASPNAGDSIDIFDYANTFDTNPLTIARNGQPIESLAENLTANVEGAYFTLIYTGATRGWQILPRYGVSGIEDVLSAEGDLLYRGASSETRLPIGTAGQVLKVNSGATAPEWGSISGSISVTGSDLTLSGATGTPITNATLATTGVGAGTYTKVTVDTKGRVTTGATATPADIGAAATSHVHAASDVTSGVFDNARINFAAPDSIGSTTRNSGAFTTLTANNGIPLTASAPVLDLAQTWNNAAVQFTGLRFNVTDTNSASNSILADFQRNGASFIRLARSFSAPYIYGTTNDSGIGFTTTGIVVRANGGDIAVMNTGNFGLSVRSDGRFAWAANTNPTTASDLELFRDATDTLAQRRGLNPQTFRIYGQITGTDTSATGNYERGFMRWSAAGGVFQIGTEKGSGGGLARALEFQTDGITRFTITTGGSVIHAIPDGVFGWSASTLLRPISGNGTLRLSNSAQTDFNLLQFGGTTSSFPALKRNSTTLEVRLANDSGFAPLSCGALTLNGNLVLTDNTGSETATFDAQGKLTANQTYNLPDASGTLALTSDTTKNLWIPASAWIPKTTAGCGVDSRETTTNDQNFDELLFDAGSDEFADALVVMPSNYNNGTITARFYWTAASGSGDVIWAIQGRAFANDDALDTAAGTAQTVTDTLIAANDMHVSGATSAVTIGGTPAANTPIQFSIYRDANAAGDTLAVDARFLGAEIIFN